MRRAGRALPPLPKQTLNVAFYRLILGKLYQIYARLSESRHSSPPGIADAAAVLLA